MTGLSCSGLDWRVQCKMLLWFFSLSMSGPKSSCPGETLKATSRTQIHMYGPLIGPLMGKEKNQRRILHRTLQTMSSMQTWTNKSSHYIIFCLPPMGTGITKQKKTVGSCKFNHSEDDLVILLWSLWRWSQDRKLLVKHFLKTVFTFCYFI